MTMINTDVHVNAFYFAGRAMRSFPKTIEYQGRAVTFASGLQLLIRRGQSRTLLYDMDSVDGAVYRLSRTGSQWTLIGVKGAC